MRLLLPAFILAGAVIAAPAFAQPIADPVQGPAAEVVKQVIVYGDDACPPSAGEEIVVCARMAERERYRIPQALRDDPNASSVQSWTNRVTSLEYVGKSGTDSCSPVGGGGFTGCFAQIARAAKLERKTMLGDASWADAVAAERARRLGRIDADSVAIEAQVREEEARQAAGTSAPTSASVEPPLTDEPLPDPNIRPAR